MESHAINVTKREPVWKYRKALFLFDFSWNDCGVLQKDFRGRAIAQQLIRSVGSISANIEEGHGRGFFGKERLQFLRYAMGSARETKGWYLRGRHLFSKEIFEHRSSLIDEVISLLLTELRTNKK
ncbi:MAG: four helix bundle protein [Candidatus Latescibacteria bacterium]|jgi:four helix bundle protein|nr:four helix bundle protein [Candidatus Latescibacterota bacterium]